MRESCCAVEAISAVELLEVVMRWETRRVKTRGLFCDRKH